MCVHKTREPEGRGRPRSDSEMERLDVGLCPEPQPGFLHEILAVSSGVGGGGGGEQCVRDPHPAGAASPRVQGLQDPGGLLPLPRAAPWHSGHRARLGLAAWGQVGVLPSVLLQDLGPDGCPGPGPPSSCGPFSGTKAATAAPKPAAPQTGLGVIDPDGGAGVPRRPHTSWGPGGSSPPPHSCPCQGGAELTSPLLSQPAAGAWQDSGGPEGRP